MDTPPDWLERLANAAERWNVRVQLLVGAILVGIIDYAMLSRTFQGLVTNPTWLALAIPIAVTALWLILAVWAIRSFRSFCFRRQLSIVETADVRDETQGAG